MEAVTKDQLPGTTGSRCDPAMTTHGLMMSLVHQWTIASGARSTVAYKEATLKNGAVDAPRALYLLESSPPRPDWTAWMSSI